MNINELQRNLILVYSRLLGGKDLTKCGYEIEDHLFEDTETGFIESAEIILVEGVRVKVFREWLPKCDIDEDFELNELVEETIDLDLHSLIYHI